MLIAELDTYNVISFAITLVRLLTSLYILLELDTQ